MKKIMDLNQPIRRSFQLLDLKADETESGIIEGHPAVYDQAASIGNYFIEIIERGAFNNCDFDDVLFSVNHDLDRIPLARSRRNNKNSTMQIGPDDIGLGIRAKIDIEKNVEAQSLYSAIQRGDIDGMSFIFYVASDNWENLDTDMPTRRITEIRKVIEVSAVNFPAYQGTNINARDLAALDNVARALDNARSELDNSGAEIIEIERLRVKAKAKA